MAVRVLTDGGVFTVDENGQVLSYHQRGIPVAPFVVEFDLAEYRRRYGHSREVYDLMYLTRWSSRQRQPIFALPQDPWPRVQEGWRYGVMKAVHGDLYDEAVKPVEIFTRF